MGIIDRAYVKASLCTPHTWHAAEAFLYPSNEGVEAETLRALRLL